MTEFKQIIGRGTRINEDYGKFYFTIMDFKKATELFADPAFDGDPVQVYEPEGDASPVPPDEPDEQSDDQTESRRPTARRWFIRYRGRWGRFERAAGEICGQRCAGFCHRRASAVL